MNKTFYKCLSIIFFLGIFFSVTTPKQIVAQQPGQACSNCGTCSGRCIYNSSLICTCLPQNPATGNGNPATGGQGQPTTGGQQPATGQGTEDPFGTVKSPLGYGDAAIPGSGLIILLNNLLRLVFVAAGIFAFIRFVLAGLKFMASAGDPKGIEAAWAAIWQSLLGLAIMISAFAVAALVGQLLFGDATAILNPKIYGPK